MENYSKLKGPIGWMIPVAVFVFLFFIVIEFQNTGTFNFVVWSFGAFFIILGVIDFLKTRLVTILMLYLMLGTGSWHCLLAFKRFAFFSPLTYGLHVTAFIVFILFTWPILSRHSRLNNNARNLFKLAAEVIYETTNGFTARPYSAGTTEYSKEEILGFSRFMSGRSIARSKVQKNGITLVFSMGISPLSNPPLEKTSYLTFDYEGNISVHISKYDYRRYKEQLTFDQLCASIGNVFKRFLKYYQDGTEMRIITELKS